MFEPQAERRVKLGLLIGEIIRSENLTLDQERVKRMIEEFAESYEDPQEVIDFYANDREQRAGIENAVLEDQVVDWILGQAKVEDESISFDDLMAQK
jgi:trigger factor